jgi:hypothetical protein
VLAFSERIDALGGSIRPQNSTSSRTDWTSMHRWKFTDRAEGYGLDAVSLALRWLIQHSQLNAERNDGVIIGASSLEHLRRECEEWNDYLER